MDPYGIIDKYYSDAPLLRRILTDHSEAVMRKTLECIARHTKLGIDGEFAAEAALLHDIGIFLTHAPSIQCMGKLPYIAHGLAGKLILETEGLPRHARVAALHTGAGLTIEDIEVQNLPLPKENLCPQTLEEKLVCYADKFFSKGKVCDPTTGEVAAPREKSLEEVLAQMSAHGVGTLARFKELHRLFG